MDKKLTKQEAIKKIFHIISTQDDIREAEELAWQYDVALTEVWNNDDSEIIGMMVDDETIYF